MPPTPLPLLTHQQQRLDRLSIPNFESSIHTPKPTSKWTPSLLPRALVPASLVSSPLQPLRPSFRLLRRRGTQLSPALRSTKHCVTCNPFHISILHLRMLHTHGYTQGKLALSCCALASGLDLGLKSGLPPQLCCAMGCRAWTGQNIFTSSRFVRRLSESCCTRRRTSSKPFSPHRHLNQPLSTYCHINNNHHESEGRDLT